MKVNGHALNSLAMRAACMMQQLTPDWPREPSNRICQSRTTSRAASGQTGATIVKWLMLTVTFAILYSYAPEVHAHGVTDGDKGYIQEVSGFLPIQFIYLGAKHMVTGYDHLLFLVGVIFFLFRLRDVGIYVTLFAVGHSTTLLFGVLTNTTANAYIIDAIIGFSIVYKALDNMGAYQRWFGIQPNTKVATLIFGFFHGFGLATKILDFGLSKDGLIPNLVAFNVGVEIGQLTSLGFILILMGFWRRSDQFLRHAYAANVVLMTGGFLLIGYQLAGYFLA